MLLVNVNFIVIIQRNQMTGTSGCEPKSEFSFSVGDSLQGGMFSQLFYSFREPLPRSLRFPHATVRITRCQSTSRVSGLFALEHKSAS